MKIIVCPDSFKGAISSLEAGKAIKQGLQRILPDARIIVIPVADGGEGTVEALLFRYKGKRRYINVLGPLKKPVRAWYAIAEKTAMIEMAAASGLPLLSPKERNPLRTSTFGTGMLIRDAIQQGANNILIGVGGSATVDGGMGMAEALGIRFVNIRGEVIQGCGGTLKDIADIDDSSLLSSLKKVRITVLSDVKNPLTGPNGAAAIFGPQKGATAEMVETLDTGLLHFAKVVARIRKMNIAALPGSGAAGGLAAGLMAFCNARITDGAEFILKEIGFSTLLQDASLVITGEGRIDSQTSFGKIALAVAKHAKKAEVPVIAFCGEKRGSVASLHRNGLSAVISILPGPLTLSDAMKHSSLYLRETAETIGRILKIQWKTF